MKLKDYIQIFIGVFILVGIVVVWMLNIQKKTQQNYQLSGYQYVGVVDLNVDNKVTADSILDGTDAILAIDPTWKNPVTDLLSLDADRDGFINILDPVYSHLNLILYGKKYLVVPLNKTGIRAIKVSRQNQKNSYQLIYPDNSERWLRSNK